MPRVSHNKAALRRQILTERKPQAAEAAQCLHDKLFALPQVQAAHTLFCYCSVPGEADTRAIIDTAWQMGKRVCMPLCRNKTMLTACVSEWSELCSTGAFEIPEPSNEALQLLHTDIDVSIVPGLAFDREGYRLGYGGGYYDKFLAQGGFSIGLCRAEWLLDTLPREAHDIPVSLVLTDACVLGA